MLGSTAFYGAVDTLITMRKQDGQRCIRSEQRYGENLPDVVARLDLPTGIITAAGELKTIQLDTYKTKILEELGDETLTEPDIKGRVKGNGTTTGNALRALHASRALQRTGGGVRGNPYQYSKLKTQESSILDSLPIGNLESVRAALLPGCRIDPQTGLPEF